MKQKKHIDLCINPKQAFEDSQGLVSIKISPSSQQLYLLDRNRIIKEYTISTAKNGLGEEKNSFKTPRGLHLIRAKIGADLPINAIFKARRFTGKLYTSELNEQDPTKDWILTRILWLSGLEPGFNRLGNLDTMQRYVYIHGSPDDRPTGVPTSRGCIRMRNEDIVELFDLVTYGTRVYIEH